MKVESALFGWVLVDWQKRYTVATNTLSVSAITALFWPFLCKKWQKRGEDAYGGSGQKTSWNLCEADFLESMRG